MIARWIRAPIPIRMQTRSEEENQLAQLVRWWLWVKGDKPMSRAHETIGINRDSFYRGMRGLVVKTVLAVAAAFYEDFGVEVDQDVLEQLAEASPDDGDLVWRDVAEELQAAWLEEHGDE